VNVLLVDDEPIELEQLEYLIKPVCPLWNLYTAMDSSQALHLCKQEKFQLAFLDIEMPGKSGIDLATDLKAMFKDIEIVIVTAHQDFEYARRSIQIGVSDYLTKPIIEHELMAVIKKYAQDIHYMSCSKIVSDALQVIYKNYYDKLNLSLVAREIHVNSSYLSRKFSEDIGMSFSDYLTNYRVEVAKTLLTSEENLSTSQVSEQVGFTSLHYFSSIFKKKVGITAKKYREMGI
jgi:two-component system response regulator YesN